MTWIHTTCMWSIQKLYDSLFCVYLGVIHTRSLKLREKCIYIARILKIGNRDSNTGIKRAQGLLTKASNTIEILITKKAYVILHFCNLTSSDASMHIRDLDYLGINPKKQIPPKLPLFTDLLMFCMPLTQRRKQWDLKQTNKANPTHNHKTKLLLNGIYCQKSQRLCLLESFHLIVYSQ